MRTLLPSTHDSIRAFFVLVGFLGELQTEEMYFGLGPGVVNRRQGDLVHCASSSMASEARAVAWRVIARPVLHLSHATLSLPRIRELEEVACGIRSECESPSHD